MLGRIRTVAKNRRLLRMLLLLKLLNPELLVSDNLKKPVHLGFLLLLQFLMQLPKRRSAMVMRITKATNGARGKIEYIRPGPIRR